LSRARPVSARNNADAAGERFRHRQLAAHDLERQRGQGARRRTIDDRRALARIVVRIVAGAFESLLLRRPDIHLAAGVWADRGQRLARAARAPYYAPRSAVLEEAAMKRDADEAVAGLMKPMMREDVTDHIAFRKVKKAIKWADVAKKVCQSKEWTTAACLGQL